MSLLLDALKRAAEQKAEKSKEGAAEARPSDEALRDAVAEDSSALDDGDDSDLQLPQHQLEDETELDYSELDARLERARAASEARESAARDLPDASEMETAASAGERTRSGEDETLTFDSDDLSEFMGEPQFIRRDYASTDDETDLSRPADQTDISRAAADASDTGPVQDETDLSELAYREDETDFRAPHAGGDETDLSQLGPSADRTEFGKSPPAGDETELSQLDQSADQADHGEPESDDETDLGQLGRAADETDPGVPLRADDETDLSQLEQSADQVDHGEPESDDETDLGQLGRSADDTDLGGADSPRADSDDTDISHPDIRGGAPVIDDDLSLYLADQTGMTEPTSATDPQAAGDQLAALRQSAGGDDEFALVDTTRHSLPAEETLTGSRTQTTSSAPTRVRQDTETTVTEGTTRRAETLTYAPDNYDRTLMKLPNDDASRLFAGMKSDSDVVMTPDYAKKVFRSKSSAQRMQHLKIYGGIAIAIVLAIGIYGVFEYQQEASSIDTSLRPLKRDPMPGTIRPPETKQRDLFAGTPAEVDERTLELVQNAASMSEAPEDETPVSGEAQAEDSMLDESLTQAPAAAESASEVASADESDPSTDRIAAAQSRQASPAASTAAETDESAETPRVAASASSKPAPVAGASDDASGPASVATAAAVPVARSGNLSISSSSRPEQKRLWLNQAYAAYQAGNDKLALELYNKVLALEPGNRNALLARAAISVQNNDIAAAIEDYQVLLLANPQDSLAMSSLIAVSSLSPQDAESRLKLLLRNEPDSPYLNFALANAYGAQNRWQEAQRHYFEALTHNPGDPNYAYNLAVSLEHIAKPKVAITYYQRALDNINNGLATFNREVVMDRLEILRKL